MFGLGVRQGCSHPKEYFKQRLRGPSSTNSFLFQNHVVHELSQSCALLGDRLTKISVTCQFKDTNQETEAKRQKQILEQPGRKNFSLPNKQRMMPLSHHSTLLAASQVTHKITATSTIILLLLDDGGESYYCRRGGHRRGHHEGYYCYY
jgi:hypothetical protein